MKEQNYLKLVKGQIVMDIVYLLFQKLDSISELAETVQFLETD